MTDPMNALTGLQTAINARTVRLTPCDLHSEIQMLFDEPNGKPRFTYAQVQAGAVQAIMSFVLVEPVQGVPCFQMGYAVIETMRGQGIGARIVEHAIDELRHGLGRTPAKEFYLEAVVSDSNVASNKIARRLISHSPKSCSDCFSGEPAHQYLRRIQCSV
jgi:GNAT superfamily N-acetyltransferase